MASRIELYREAPLAHQQRNALAALRLLVEGVRDGVLETTPGSGVLEGMVTQVTRLCELLDEQDRRISRPRLVEVPRPRTEDLQAFAAISARASARSASETSHRRSAATGSSA